MIVTPRYVPIVKAKAGEFDAHLSLNATARRLILPMFELPRFTQQVAEQVKYRDQPNPLECYLHDLAGKICRVREEESVMFDISTWPTDSVTESGEHVLSFMAKAMAERCETIPVIGYDRWDDPEYLAALRNLSSSHERFCLRLESYAFEDMSDEDYFLEAIENIVAALDLATNQCNVILDLHDVTQESVVELQEKLELAMSLLSGYDFAFISVAGCSVTPVINDMVPQINSTATVLRREMIAWQAIRASSPFPLVFGDYGTSSPYAAESGIAPHANGKIRYTVEKNYYVVRGYSRSKGEKGAQMYELAQQVAQSSVFAGDTFSWGDSRIVQCSHQEFTGRPQDWIAIETNHHTHYALAEVAEYLRSRAVQELAPEDQSDGG